MAALTSISGLEAPSRREYQLWVWSETGIAGLFRLGPLQQNRISAGLQGRLCRVLVVQPSRLHAPRRGRRDACTTRADHVFVARITARVYGTHARRTTPE